MRVADADRAAAKKWLAAYGLEKAMWMIARCVKTQKERGGPGILVFGGLQRYEGVAAGAYERQERGKGGERTRRAVEEMDGLWNSYQRKLVELFDSQADPAEVARLSAETLSDLRREMSDRPAFIAEAHLIGRLRALKCARMNALGEAEFRRHENRAALREALLERHGVDVLPEEPGLAA